MAFSNSNSFSNASLDLDHCPINYTSTIIASTKPMPNSAGLIPIHHIFSTLKTSLRRPTQVSHSLSVQLSPRPPSPVAKRSTRIHNKKARALGLEIDSLSKDDIIFINSLTAGDLAKLGVACGVKFHTSVTNDPIGRMKMLEQEHCNKSSESLLSSAA
ncbi:hypothetical protein COCNU_03G001180 [Cocos nucifera]|uniref:Uncharacterized protein n=1 Tax=Cocos nucifera TaxID=13894 RepID=A0A8K0I1Z9_COCNU|nr:hypothetical protein COCNU_03G001180 [Cocos nucifera]